MGSTMLLLLLAATGKILAQETTSNQGHTEITDSSLDVPTGSSTVFSFDPSSTIFSFDPTSTAWVTTYPAGASTELVTSVTASWNTWLTTSKDQSSSTVVPVIWCPDCGGPVVIWNFPGPSNIVIDLPDLPPFKLPCIGGGCSAPETVDSGGGGGGDKPDKPDGDKPDGDKPDDDKPGDDKPDDDKPDDDKPDDDSSKTSSSSTATCSGGTTTVSSCAQACSAFLTATDNTAVSTTVCYTTSCKQVVGCSVEGTTTSSITTSSAAACPMRTNRLYNARASYENAGMQLPPWLQYPLTYYFVTNLLPPAVDDIDYDGDPDDDEPDDPNDPIDGPTSGTNTGFIESTASSLDTPTSGMSIFPTQTGHHGTAISGTELDVPGTSSSTTTSATSPT
jgi:hypothetical protein